MSYTCNHDHKQVPFKNQLPSNGIIAEYKLWLCSKCHKWYSLLPSAKKEYMLAQQKE